MMTTTLTTCEIEELVDEVEHYLEAVEVFRAEGCEPAWARDEAAGAVWPAARSDGARRCDSGIFSLERAA